MAIKIKSPQEDSLHKGSNSPSRPGKESEPGYQGRTSSPNAPTQKVYEPDYPKGGLDIKTPAGPFKK